MLELLDVNTTFFTVMGYLMSYLEFFGTLLNIGAVWLVARNKILNWPVGLVAILLFGFLFYQIQLYSDFIEQIFYFATGVWGWIAWSKHKSAAEDAKARIVPLAARGRLFTMAAIALGTLAMGTFIANIHTILPAFFAEPASYPYFDALTTVMSFTAQILMIYRRLDNWLIWIVVDVIGIGLYWVKDVKLISLLYAVFLVLATKGYFNWRKEMRGYSQAGEE
jgi:nicotinamide mononucleotide transporter